MKETIYTIPLTEGFEEGGECPFCNIHDKLNKESVEYMMGSAYMEDYIRMETNKTGFCKEHYRQMYTMENKNRLGLALVMHTHLQEINKKLSGMKKTGNPIGKKSLFSSFSSSNANGNPISTYLNQVHGSCFICNRVEQFMDRYIDTFFYLWKKEDGIKNLLKQSKGFCIEHYSIVLERGAEKLKQKDYQQLVEILVPLQLENFKRIEEELDWFIKKYDYRFTNEPWKNSKDSVGRGILKLAGEKVTEA